MGEAYEKYEGTVATHGTKRQRMTGKYCEAVAGVWNSRPHPARTWDYVTD